MHSGKDGCWTWVSMWLIWVSPGHPEEKHLQHRISADGQAPQIVAAHSSFVGMREGSRTEGRRASSKVEEEHTIDPCEGVVTGVAVTPIALHSIRFVYGLSCRLVHLGPGRLRRMHITRNGRINSIKLQLVFRSRIWEPSPLVAHGKGDMPATRPTLTAPPSPTPMTRTGILINSNKSTAHPRRSVVSHSSRPFRAFPRVLQLHSYVHRVLTSSDPVHLRNKENNLHHLIPSSRWMCRQTNSQELLRRNQTR